MAARGHDTENTSSYFEIAAYRPHKTADIGFSSLAIEDT